jgi:hypothetical protein
MIHRMTNSRHVGVVGKVEDGRKVGRSNDAFQTAS